MNNDVSQEVAAVNRMYESGKITAEERDKLIAALDDGEETTKTISIDYDDDIDDDDEVEIDEQDEIELEEDLNEIENDVGELRELKELEGLKDKIVKTVKKSLGAAKRAMKEAEKSADENCRIVINTDDGENRVVDRAYEKFDVPYNDLTVTLKYVNGGTVLKISDSVVKTEKILEQCAEVMDDESLTIVRDLFDSQFTGGYKNVKGGKVLKLEIAP